MPPVALMKTDPAKFGDELAPLPVSVAEDVGDGAGADPLQEGGHGRGVTQPRAVIDVVGAQGGPHQLLEEVRLLVGALGRAEAGEGAGAVGFLDLAEPPRDEVERLVPGRLAEGRQDAGVIDDAPG